MLLPAGRQILVLVLGVNGVLVVLFWILDVVLQLLLLLLLVLVLTSFDRYVRVQIVVNPLHVWHAAHVCRHVLRFLAVAAQTKNRSAHCQITSIRTPSLFLQHILLCISLIYSIYFFASYGYIYIILYTVRLDF